MKNKLTFLSLFLFFSLKLYCQDTYLALGYSVGKFTSGLPNLRNQLYEWNTVTYKNFDKKFNLTNINRGFNFELGFIDDELYFYTGWSNKHLIVKGSGKNPKKPTEDLDIAVKVRHNHFTLFGIGYLHDEKYGFSLAPVDITTMKILSKSSAADNPNKWYDLYAANKGLLSSYTDFGSTVNFDYFFHDKFKTRVSWYVDWFGIDVNIQPNYRYKANSVNLSVSYVLSNK